MYYRKRGELLPASQCFDVVLIPRHDCARDDRVYGLYDHVPSDYVLSDHVPCDYVPHAHAHDLHVYAVLCGRDRISLSVDALFFIFLRLFWLI